jgi:O-antigen/teichoic acid export membrane protein
MAEAKEPHSPSAPSVGRSVGSAAVYSAAYAAQRAIAFLLLPVYTRALTPAEYGTLGLVISIAGFAVVAFSLGLEVAIVRTYFQLGTDESRRAVYIDTVRKFLLLYPLAIAVAASAVAWPFLDGGLLVVNHDLALVLVGSALQVAGTVLPLAVLRAKQDLSGFLRVTGVNIAITPVATVFFVVALDWGVTGFLLGLLVGNLATVVAAQVVLPWNWRAKASLAEVRRAVRFSVPFVPHTLSHWALNLADRTIISGMISAVSLGVYTLAANIAGTLSMLVISVNQGFIPMYARAGAEGSGVRDIATLQIGVVTGLALAVGVCGGPVATFLAPAEYAGAGDLVPWLVLGFWFYGMANIPLNGATLMAGRSAHVWVATATAAGVNVLLLVLFVPEYGIEAAAIAAAGAYGVMFVGLTIWSHIRPNPVEYDWSRIARILGVAAGVYAVSVGMPAQGPRLDVVQALAAWLLFPIGLIATRTVHSRPIRDTIFRTFSRS